jgi:hypothetical protein
VRLALALSFGMLCATSVGAEIAPAEHRIVTEIQQLGCRAEVYLLMEQNPELTEGDMLDFLQKKVPSGDVFVDPQGRLVLSEANCPGGYKDGPPKPDDDIRAVLIEVITAKGCKMTEAEAEVELPKRGLQKESTGDMVELMVEMGEARLEGDDDRTLVLLTQGCPS